MHDEIAAIRDKLRRNAGSPLAIVTLTREIGDAKLTLVVAPCSWMYAGHELQVEVTMAGGGWAMIRDKRVKFQDATEADMQRLFDQVKVVTCSRCGKPAFDPTSVETNRAGLCESCHSEDFDKELRQAEARMRQRRDQLDAEYRTVGFTHRVDAWVHPVAGGDDYPVNIWFKGEPSADTVAAKLQEIGSSVLTDYQLAKI